MFGSFFHKLITKHISIFRNGEILITCSNTIIANIKYKEKVLCQERKDKVRHEEFIARCSKLQQQYNNMKSRIIIERIQDEDRYSLPLHRLMNKGLECCIQTLGNSMGTHLASTLPLSAAKPSFRDTIRICICKIKATLISDPISVNL